VGKGAFAPCPPREQDSKLSCRNIAVPKSKAMFSFSQQLSQICPAGKALLASEWWARRERAFAHPTQTDPDLAEQALESEQSFLIIVVAAKRRTVGWAKRSVPTIIGRPA